MSGRPKIEIKESAEQLSKMLKTQKRSLEYNKVLTLYLFVTKQVLTIRKAGRILNKGTATINRWLKQYKEGGIENLLKNRQTIGRPKKLSGETLDKI